MRLFDITCNGFVSHKAGKVDIHYANQLTAWWHDSEHVTCGQAMRVFPILSHNALRARMHARRPHISYK